MKIREDVELTLAQTIEVRDTVKIITDLYITYYRVIEIFSWDKCILENVFSGERIYTSMSDVILYEKWNK